MLPSHQKRDYVEPNESNAIAYSHRNSHFDVERVKRAAAMLVGKHDFRTFMQISRDEKTVNISLVAHALREFFADFRQFHSKLPRIPGDTC